MTIRICPERDGPCPHGLDCPYAVDRYRCNKDRPMTTTDAIPADVVEAVQEAAIEFGLMLTDEHATALAKAADRASRAPVDGAEAKPDFWAVHSKSGAHVGLWPDKDDAERAFREYAASGKITPLYTIPPAPAASPDAGDS